MNTRELWSQHHPYINLEIEAAAAVRVDVDDSRIIKRIVAAYLRSAEQNYYGSDSMWRVIRAQRHSDLHELLVSGPSEELAEAFRSPKDNDLLYGFEMLYRERYQQIVEDPHQKLIIGARVTDHLVRLAEALGVLRVENPESGPWLENLNRPVPKLIKSIERKLEFALSIPAFYEGLMGLPMRGGVLTYRMIHSAYCASRVRSFTPGKVLEIGGGIGYLAYYAYNMGLDFTIVDLPIINAAQAYFLMRTLGEEAVVLDGEAAHLHAIKIRTPAHMNSEERYDLVVNVDSLTEVGTEIAKAYLRWIIEHADRFWSVNHESNTFTVNELLKDLTNLRVERFPYWMRSGYVEEIVTHND